MLNGHNYHSSITLFERLGTVCHGFNQDQVADAAINLVINAIAQSYRNPLEAERAWDALSGGARTHLLLDCYDAKGPKKAHMYYQLVRG